MRPGQWSRFGFLGPKESLEEVIAHDKHTLEKFGLENYQIANVIEDILNSAKNQESILSLDMRIARYAEFPVLGSPDGVPSFSSENLPSLEKGYCVDQFQVFTILWLGFQDCPWGCKDAKGNFDFLILNRNTGQSFTGPALIIHMIRSHEFFEGLESPFRLDPEKAIRVLEIAKLKAG